MVMDAAVLRLADLESRRICRFCLRACSVDEGQTAIGEDEELVSRVEFALTLEVAEQDGLPQRICGGCQWLIEKFYLFKDQCVRAEMLLKTFTESGLPMLQYFEPVDFAEFRWDRKWGDGIDVGIQVEETVVKKEPVETEAMYEMMAPEMIKQEPDADDWRLAEEGEGVEGFDHSDRVTMDELARQLYENEEAAQNMITTVDQEIEESQPDGIHDVTDLITEIDIGSPQLATISVDLYEDISNDTVEFSHLPGTSSAANEPNQPPTPSISGAEEMLFLLKDGEPSGSSKSTIDSPQSPSDIIYKDIRTTPLRESDGLSSRFVDMEPGEIVSDDEYDTVVIISSDTEDNPEETQPPKPVAELIPLTLAVKPPTPKPNQYQCQKCDKFFPQSQLLEAHTKAYHIAASPAKSPSSSNNGGTATVAAVARKSFGKASVPKRMAIMIDNPVKKCPKCGIMVHKVSYAAHRRAHRSGGGESEPLMNYEVTEPATESVTNTERGSSSPEESWD